MKRRPLAALVLTALLLVAVCASGCVFSSTVPDTYYSYSVDLSAEAGRALFDRYDGAAVLVRVDLYEGEGKFQLYRASTSTGVYVSEDGFLMLPAGAFVPERYDVNRCGITVTYFTENGAVTSERVWFYSYALGNNLTIDENIFLDEESGVALVKFPLEGRENVWMDVSEENAASFELSDELYLFSVLPEGASNEGTRLLSLISVAGGEHRADKNSYVYDNVPRGGRFDNIVSGHFSHCDVGGIAVDANGRVAGMVISRLMGRGNGDDAAMQQSDSIYGIAGMADVSRLSALLEAAQRSGYAQ